MQKEIEIKIQLKDKENIAKKLKELGGKKGKSYTQTTYGFFSNDSIEKGIFPRIRQEDNSLVLTVKLRKDKKTKYFERKEYSIKIDNLKDAIKILQLFGYDRIREFTKFREEWTFKRSVKVNIDKLNFGRFIEIEGPKKEIERMVSDLGFQDRERFTKAYLALEDGSIYEGWSFGAEDTTCGEVVFNTSMSGYQEMLTDPSYAGQILVLTYPLIGNYGVNDANFESKQVQVRGLIVREHCTRPSHWQSSGNLSEFLQAHGIPGITGVDTRALTRRLRSAGVMMGILTSEMTPEEALQELKSLPRYDSIDFVEQVATDKIYQWESTSDDTPKHNIVIVDMGLKYNIARILAQLGCRVTVVPCIMPAEEILNLEPDGIVLSPGPGDPALLGYITETVKKLISCKPAMG